MAEIEVRTPEDLDKVFTDLFRYMADIYGRSGNIESELHKLNTPTITTTPYITPSWVSPAYGPGSVVPIRPTKLTLTTTGSWSMLDKMLSGGGDYEETKDE